MFTCVILHSFGGSLYFPAGKYGEYWPQRRCTFSGRPNGGSDAALRNCSPLSKRKTSSMKMPRNMSAPVVFHAARVVTVLRSPCSASTRSAGSGRP